MVFMTYVGEKTGHVNQKEFIYYNLKTSEWTSQKAVYPTNELRAKSSVFKIKDKIIRAGGSQRDVYSNDDIYLFDINTGAVNLVGTLPFKIYSAASIFYMNKIYISGGGDSFGRLQLENVVKNDVVVIDLNENCEGKVIYVYPSALQAHIITKEIAKPVQQVLSLILLDQIPANSALRKPILRL